MSLAAQQVFDNDYLRRYIFTFHDDYQKPKKKCLTNIKNFFNSCITNIQLKIFIDIFHNIRLPISSRL